MENKANFSAANKQTSGTRQSAGLYQQPLSKQQTEEDADMFKILITTDNHLGFKEHDKITGNDSFYAFNETLQIASDKKVDFVLLGGDLFHEQRPSSKTYYRASKIFNKHVFGQQQVAFETFQYNRANYLNPALSVRLPIFSIHGNHDDPTGLELFSSLDQVCINHYVNYFGKIKNIEQIEVTPILFTKGETKIALYGIGHMKDERLNLAFETKNIKFKRPLQDKDKWFNILVLHQNKFKGLALGPSKRCSIMENQLPSFFDLVIWAHEHESIPNVYECEETGVHFLQPGSTVITSLCEAETKPKHCFILKIKQSAFTCKPIRLRCVRNFVFRTTELGQTRIDPRKTQMIEKHIKEQVENMIQTAIEMQSQSQSTVDQAIYSYDSKKVPEELKLPFIRLKIDYSKGYSVIKSRTLNSFFDGRLANISDYLQFFKRTGFAGGNNQNGRQKSGQRRDNYGINNDDDVDYYDHMGVLDMNKFLMTTIKAKDKDNNRGIKIDASKFIQMMDQAVATNNPNLIEKIYDKEIFHKVFKGVKDKLISNGSSSIGGNNNNTGIYQELIEQGDLDVKIMQLSKDIMKQLNLADTEEEKDNDEQQMENIEHQMLQNKNVNIKKENILGLSNKEDDLFDEIFRENDQKIIKIDRKYGIKDEKAKEEHKKPKMQIKEEVKTSSNTNKKQQQIDKQPQKQQSREVLDLEAESSISEEDSNAPNNLKFLLNERSSSPNIASSSPSQRSSSRNRKQRQKPNDSSSKQSQLTSFIKPKTNKNTRMMGLDDPKYQSKKRNRADFNNKMNDNKGNDHESIESDDEDSSPKHAAIKKRKLNQHQVQKGLVSSSSVANNNIGKSRVKAPENKDEIAMVSQSGRLIPNFNRYVKKK